MMLCKLKQVSKKDSRCRTPFLMYLDFRAVDDESGTAPANKTEGTHVFHPFQE